MSHQRAQVTSGGKQNEESKTRKYVSEQLWHFGGTVLHTRRNHKTSQEHRMPQEATWMRDWRVRCFDGVQVGSAGAPQVEDVVEAEIAKSWTCGSCRKKGQLRGMRAKVKPERGSSACRH